MSPPGASGRLLADQGAMALGVSDSDGDAGAVSRRVTVLPTGVATPAAGDWPSTRSVGSGESARVTSPRVSPALRSAATASPSEPCSAGTVTSDGGAWVVGGGADGDGGEVPQRSDR